MNIPDSTTVLWTGGWDSTFRVLEAVAIEKRNVQPYYVIDPDRPSTMHELRAMASIRQAISRDLGSGHRLEPTRIFLRYEFPRDDHLAGVFQRTSRRAHIGAQYLWLAEFCQSMALTDIELCMPKHEIASDLQQILFDDPHTNSPTLSNDEAVDLFRFYRFPLLGQTKATMRKQAEAHGFLDVLEMSWFCHHPVGHKPCGHCRPCHIARESERNINFARIGGVVYHGRRAWKRAARLASRLINASSRNEK